MPAQPPLERSEIVMQRRQMLDRGEVVALSRTIHTTPICIKPSDRPPKPDLVDEREDDVGSVRAACHHLLQNLDVGCELNQSLRVALLVESARQFVEVNNVALFGNPVSDPRVERTRWPTQRFANIGRVKPPAAMFCSYGKAEPGQHGADRCAVSKLKAHSPTDRDLGRRQRNLHRCQECVNPAEHSDVCGR